MIRSKLEIPHSRIGSPKRRRCVVFRKSKVYESTVGAHLSELITIK